MGKDCSNRETNMMAMAMAMAMAAAPYGSQSIRTCTWQLEASCSLPRQVRFPSGTKSSSAVFVTAVYMFFCALGGFLYFFLKWLVRVMRRDNSECYYMTWKYWMNIVRATYWLGIAFGIKLGVGNIGLDLVIVDYHVLFEATALAWVALLGYCLLNEK